MQVLSKNKMTKKERVERLRELLDATYPVVKCSLDFETPLEMLIATQLSAQCTDARVNIVTRDLFDKYKTAADYKNAELSDIEEIIRSVGFYKNKAKNMIACCKRIDEVYGGNVPDTMEDLLTLPGTGRKTANLVLGDIFGKPAYVVDTHCIRLTNRIGLVKDDDPTRIEMELRKILPPDYSLRFCHQMVYHGRARCNARKPDCENCEIKSVCKQVGIKK